nr:hypothetical protein [Trentepohlia sp. YN1317]
MNKLATKKYIKISQHKKNTTEKAISNKALSTLHEYDIVQYYNSIIRGLLNYYSPCLTNTRYINFTIFLLNSSCIHTLAQKFKTTTSKIIAKYGNPICINLQIVNPNNSQIIRKKTCELLTYKNINLILEQANTRRIKIISELKRTPENLYDLAFNETNNDPFSFKFLNWRSGTILKAENCCICGISSQFSKIQIHHTKHIAKDKTSGFSQIIRQINRKQIPVCVDCHKSIHNGTYDGLKLSDFAFPQYFDMEKQI